MTTASTITSNEAQIRQLIAAQQRAICTKNLEQIMSHYASEVIVFDVKLPFQTKGKKPFRQVWKTSLPCMPASSGTETWDLSINVSGGLGLAHWISRFTGIDPDHPAAQMWLRVTAGYQRYEDGWQIVHEHVSVPFDPETAQAVFTLEV